MSQIETEYGWEAHFVVGCGVCFSIGGCSLYCRLDGSIYRIEIYQLTW